MLVSASRKVSHLPFATPKAVVRLRVVYPLLFDQNQHCFLLNWINQRRKCVVSLRWPSRDFRAQHKPNESVYIGKEFNSHRIILVHQNVLCFIVSEEKMINSCSSEATAIQRQNNCPSLHDESTSSRTPTEQATFVSIYTLQNRRVPVINLERPVCIRKSQTSALRFSVKDLILGPKVVTTLPWPLMDSFPLTIRGKIYVRWHWLP